MEYAHHGDPLVPRQQRFGRYTLSMMKGLGVPVQNQYGLRPATVKGTNQITPLTAFRDLDTRGWLSGVTTFNFHPHLPHYALDHGRHESPFVFCRSSRLICPGRILSRKQGTRSSITSCGCRQMKSVPGHLLADSTIFTTFFGGDRKSWKSSGEISPVS